jgi:hypothetical protein
VTPSSLVPLALALVVEGHPASGYEGEQSIDDWLMTGVGAPDYALTRDDGAVRIEKKVTKTQRWVAVVHEVQASMPARRNFHASFEVHTDGLDEEGSCVMKAQRGRDLEYEGFLASDLKPVKTTTSGFVRCDLSMDVPVGTKWILYGFTYRGAGRAWVRDEQ